MANRRQYLRSMVGLVAVGAGCTSSGNGVGGGSAPSTGQNSDDGGGNSQGSSEKAYTLDSYHRYNISGSVEVLDHSVVENFRGDVDMSATIKNQTNRRALATDVTVNAQVRAYNLRSGEERDIRYLYSGDAEDPLSTSARPILGGSVADFTGQDFEHRFELLEKNDSGYRIRMPVPDGIDMSDVVEIQVSRHNSGRGEKPVNETDDSIEAEIGWDFPDSAAEVTFTTATEEKTAIYGPPKTALSAEITDVNVTQNDDLVLEDVTVSVSNVGPITNIDNQRLMIATVGEPTLLADQYVRDPLPAGYDLNRPVFTMENINVDGDMEMNVKIDSKLSVPLPEDKILTAIIFEREIPLTHGDSMPIAEYL